MATVCQPCIVLPEHEMPREEVLRLVPSVYQGHPRLRTILRIVKNSGVGRRYFVQPAEDTIRHPGLESRNRLYEEAARRMGSRAVAGALENAGLDADEIDSIIVTSCTGFMIPSVDAHFINELGFRSDVRRTPVAQLGCAGGAAAMGRAYDLLTAYPDANVLVVAIELCSLCFQPQDESLAAVVSALIFGDGAAAAVVRGSGGRGFEILRSGSHLLTDTQHFMGFELRASGFHIILDRAVPDAVGQEIVPALDAFVGRAELELSDLDFHLFHPGGARVIEELERHLALPPEALASSRECLAEVGNLSSASVFVVLDRTFRRREPRDGDLGLMAAFGPGFSVEMNLGRWVAG